MRFKLATAIIGPNIQGIGVCSQAKRKPAGMPTARAVKMPPSCCRRWVNSFMVIGSIGAAECRAGEMRDELETLIAGARWDYDMPGNFCARLAVDRVVSVG